MPKAQLMANVEDKAGPARRPVYPDSPVNARANTTLSACPVLQQRPELLPPHLALEALPRLRLPEAALALDESHTQVPT